MKRIFFLALIYQLMAVMPGSVATAHLPELTDFNQRSIEWLEDLDDVDDDGYSLRMSAQQVAHFVPIFLHNPNDFDLLMADWALNVGIAIDWANNIKYGLPPDWPQITLTKVQ